MALVESWQTAAFAAPEYSKGANYATLLTLLVDTEKESELHLHGNRPELKWQRLDDGDVAVLCQALRECRQVKALDLSYNTLSDTAMEHISEYLKDPDCCLQSLNLSYNDFGAKGAEVLTESLQFNSSLHTLLLNGCKIGHGGGMHVASMLQVNRSISHLGLANTDLDTDCVIAMATILIGNRTLRIVDLSRPLLHSKLEETTVHLSRMLERNSTLQELCLSKHGITDTGAEWLCRHLHSNSALTHLDLSCNSLSRDGGSQLAGLLRISSPLSCLLLSANHIEDDGMEEISGALETNHTLTRLDVSSNSIGDRGLCRLAKALKKNSTLTYICIWGNRLGRPTCNAFRELLETGRLLPDCVDVKPYEVDSVTYLARSDQTLK